MKPRIGVRPIVGASTGLLILLLAWLLVPLWFPSAPPAEPSPHVTPVAPPVADSTAGGVPDAPPAADTSGGGRTRSTGGPETPAPRKTKVVPAAARVGVTLHWAGGRTRRKVSGELPRVTGVSRKATIAVEATVSAPGKVTKLSVLQGARGSAVLDRTLTAVRSWRFEPLPASRKGAAERCRITLTFRPPGR